MLWKDKYKVGVALIDEQHQELFRRVGDFLQSVRSEDPWQDKLLHVKDTLQFMQEYVVSHFQAEEQYQLELGYPGFKEHKAIHDKFTLEVVDFAKRFESTGYEEDLVQEFSGKLLAWLINHVAATDQQIGKYAQEGADKQ